MVLAFHLFLDKNAFFQCRNQTYGRWSSSFVHWLTGEEVSRCHPGPVVTHFSGYSLCPILLQRVLKIIQWA